MIMKKLNIAIACVLLAVSMAACGVKGDLTPAKEGKKNVPAKSESYKSSDESKEWVK